MTYRASHRRLLPGKIVQQAVEHFSHFDQLTAQGTKVAVRDLSQIPAYKQMVFQLGRGVDGVAYEFDLLLRALLAPSLYDVCWDGQRSPYDLASRRSVLCSTDS